MAFVTSNEGEKFLLEAMVGKTNISTGFRLHLFKSSQTPGQADTYATYSAIEANFTGYANISLAVASWGTATAGTGSGTAFANKANIAYAQQTFTMGTPGTTNDIYGYYLTDNGNTLLIGAEAFSSLKTMAVAGDAIKITPVLTLGTE